jgi:hypothetical protein
MLPSEMTDIECVSLIFWTLLDICEQSGYLSQYSDGLWAGELGFGSWQGQDSSLLHSVQIGPGAHPASYPMGT